MRSLVAVALFSTSILFSGASFAQSEGNTTAIELPQTGAASASSAGLTIDQIRAVVRDEIRKNPKLILDAVNAYNMEEQKNREVEARNNTLANKDLIAVSEGYPVIGNPEGVVSLYYFYDVNCGYCKKLEPELARFVRDNQDVRLVMREMPILAPSSHYAAQVGSVFAVLFPEQYPTFHDQLMKLPAGMKNGDIDRKVIEVLGPSKGSELLGRALLVDSDEVAKAAAARIAKTLEVAGAASINGTPFVFVEGSDGMLRGASNTAYDELGQMAKDARALAASR